MFVGVLFFLFSGSVLFWFWISAPNQASALLILAANRCIWSSSRVVKPEAMFIDARPDDVGSVAIGMYLIVSDTRVE